MRIGIPKEIKNNESRVGATPSGVAEMVAHGHTVIVQRTAGEGSGFSDADYEAAGAILMPKIEEVYGHAEMIVKVKEPIAEEYKLVEKGQILFTYLHFASDRELTDAMLASGATCIAYETVRDRQGRLPLLVPMSEVAGRMSVQQGAYLLEKPHGGKGKLMGGVPGVRPAKVTVLGAGVVGYNAAIVAAGMGAQVVIMDINLARLRDLADVLPKNVVTMFSSEYNIRRELADTDLLIGSVLVPGAKTPHLVSADMVKLMPKGSVMVDVAIDQGGCFATSHPTTHSNPTYVVDGVTHYCVTNIPGAVPMTSTQALANATLPYALKIADLGWREACKADPGLAQGVNILDGEVTFKGVADAFGLPYTPLRL